MRASRELGWTAKTKGYDLVKLMMEADMKAVGL